MVPGEDSSLIAHRGGDSGYNTVESLKKDGETSLEYEFWYMTKTSIPLIITFLLQCSLSSSALVFAGRVGTLEVGGISIGNVTFAVTSAIFIGIATCLDTVCPQAYGAGKYNMVGLYFQRGVAISFLFAVPVIAFWYNSEYVLSFLVEDADVVHIAAVYLRIMILSLPGYIIFECGKKYLQAQGDFVTGQNILFVCAPLNILLNYLFVLKYKFGYIGSPISMVLSYTLMGLTIVAYICRQIYFGNSSCWHPITGNFSAIFKNWGPLIALALPGLIMIEAEFFAFEIITVLSAKFGTEVLAAQSIVATLQTFFFQLPFSCSVAASNRIAYHIGSGITENCKTATKATMFGVGPAAGIINFTVLYFGRYKLCSLFNADPVLVNKAAGLLCVVALNQIYDCFNVMAAGVLRAQGRQRIGGYLNIMAYYLVGLEVGILLAFKFKMEVLGFWIGIGVGVLFLAIGENYFVYISNWRNIISKSQDLRHEA
ncbi:MATE family efflux transporter [Kluyveromyces lactis]|uniref:KLLA0F04279p n=1 Tax=Kluyveromyces lactis (strain ATCC 8585 / CBS 2359 / DSM 70799 / NBRC 1267 / NRRL Y-1140 / WM37) TaxID=284590 RepID=Q6CLB6_KLULA|nr:uncharacterized protein KLLA0_F04279g [Kluyveromyces lactis]CAG97981.1 KLLA0F04279p [Kluyveromyces lactis]|eukprot:XP_455273.1 uncharacterized protein KLLA0_F04279g [Kluyveromyces lactis]